MHVSGGAKLMFYLLTRFRCWDVTFLKNLTTLREAFGAGGVKVTELEDLVPALEKALAADGPTVIEVTGALMASLS